MEKLRNSLARHTGKMKDLLDDPDLGETGRVGAILDETNKLADDLLIIIEDMQRRRMDQQDRERDRLDDDRDYRDRGRDRDRDGYRGGRDSGRGRYR